MAAAESVPSMCTPYEAWGDDGGNALSREQSGLRALRQKPHANF